MSFINQMEPWFDHNEAAKLAEYMDSGGWLTEHTYTRRFENMIAAYTGSRFCSAVCNGTASLVIALLACGIGQGDEVIVPDYTMVATPNSAELINARAVFIDIEEDTLCMDFEEMKGAVTEKTRAVILVSINGRYPSRVNEIVEFCRDNRIFLIEDAAQSLGSRYQGRHVGTFGDIGCFSFSTPKIITTGQGGALITDNEELFNKIKMIKDFGRERGGIDNYLIKGWNFKFTDLQAVIGIEQMKKLEWRVNRKKEIGRLYEQMLTGIAGVKSIQTDYEETVPWFFDILADDRGELMAYLNKRDIGSREFYPPLHSQPAYGYKGLFPVTEQISTKGLWLPSSSFLTDDDIGLVCDRIRMFYS
ncbi:MAG: DegT/DnrJ/EryC1/StrS family aminotransferase [Deltaproteobacteria bacterium]